MAETRSNVRSAYSLAANAYAEKFLNELEFKPLDVQLMERLTELVGEGNRVLDLGCGPGHTVAKLAELGLMPTGVDLSPGMIEKAKALFPNLSFVEGDFFKLNENDNSVEGILAFYCIVHLQQHELETAFREILRVLKPGGTLLISFHIGADVVKVDRFLETDATLEFSPFPVDTVESAIKGAGFSVLDVIEREPYETEYPTHRCYIFARNSGDSNPTE